MKKHVSGAASAQRKTKKTKSYPALVMSIVGMAVCAFLLAPATIAWFGDGSSASLQGIKAADYDVAVVVTNGDKEIAPDADGFYTLDTGTYAVALTASGTAATGYCKVEAGGETLYTAQIAPRGSLSFTLNAAGVIDVKFTPTWGTYKGTGQIANDATVTLTAQSTPPTPVSPAKTVPAPEQSAAPEPEQSVASEPEQSAEPEPEQSVASEPEQSVASEPPQSESSEVAASESESSEAAASEPESSEPASTEPESSEPESSVSDGA